jgi:hypothetical protein
MNSQEKSQRAVADMVGAKDNVLLGLLSRITGEDLGPSNLTAMKCRIIVAKFPNGVEQYQLDGVPIVEFYPVEFNTRVKENSSYFVSATQKYRVLTTSHNPTETP